MRQRLRQTLDLTTWLGLCFLLPLLLRPMILLLYAQATGTGTPPITPAETSTSEWGASVVYAWLTASGLEYLKRQKWFTVVSERTAWWSQRLLGIAMAAATALGIHWSFDVASGTLMVSGLTFTAIGEGVFGTIRQFVFQEHLYRTSIKTYHPVTTT